MLLALPPVTGAIAFRGADALVAPESVTAVPVTFHADAIVTTGGSSLPPVHTMPVLSPVDPMGTLTGKSTASSGNMLYYGGNVEKTPAVYICYWWGSYGDAYGEKPYVQNFFNGIGGTSWGNVMTQYYSNAQGHITNPSGVLKGVAIDSSNPPLSPTQSQLAAEAAACANFWGYNANANYMILTPSGHSQSGFGTQWCAYHSTTSASGGTIAWTYLPYIHDAGASCGQNFVNGGSAGTLDGVSIVGGHEYAEAVTDQFLNAWMDSSGAENGDKCAWISPGSPGGSHDISLSTGTFAVQTTWSNAISGCAG